MVIVGNVNPGAEIIADGDIIIFGTLRGLAHAGAGGNVAAIIIAHAIDRPQFRIARHQWAGELSLPVADASEAQRSCPVIARVLNSGVHVAPCPRNFAITHGGNLNDR